MSRTESRGVRLLERQALRRLIAALIVLPLLGTGCVETALRKKNRTPDFEEIPTPPPPAPQDGSILRGQSQSGSLLFLDRKARRVGDLVTVVVVENMSARGSAGTKVGRTSGIDAKATSDVGVTDALQSFAQWIFRVVGVSNPGVDRPAGAEVNVLETETTTTFNGDGQTTRQGSFSAVVTCRVIAELPGNVFHIRGKRSLIVNHEQQILTLEGLVRRDDIGINNRVFSTALAEAQLSFDGMGVLDDKQRVPWAARIMDWVYPF